MSQNEEGPGRNGVGGFFEKEGLRRVSCSTETKKKGLRDFPRKGKKKKARLEVSLNLLVCRKSNSRNPTLRCEDIAIIAQGDGRKKSGCS